MQIPLTGDRSTGVERELETLRERNRGGLLRPAIALESLESGLTERYKASSMMALSHDWRGPKTVNRSN